MGSNRSSAAPALRRASGPGRYLLGYVGSDLRVPAALRAGCLGPLKSGVHGAVERACELTLRHPESQSLTRQSERHETDGAVGSSLFTL